MEPSHYKYEASNAILKKEIEKIFSAKNNIIYSE
jgi:hypothetical protein